MQHPLTNTPDTPDTPIFFADYKKHIFYGKCYYIEKNDKIILLNEKFVKLCEISKNNNILFKTRLCNIMSYNLPPEVDIDCLDISLFFIDLEFYLYFHKNYINLNQILCNYGITTSHNIYKQIKLSSDLKKTQQLISKLPFEIRLKLHEYLD